MLKVLSNKDGFANTETLIAMLIVAVLATFAICSFREYRWRTNTQVKIEDKIYPVREQVNSFFKSTGRLPKAEEIEKSKYDYISVESEGVIKINLNFISDGLKQSSIKIRPIVKEETLCWECSADSISQDSSEYELLPRVCIDESLNWTDKPSKLWWFLLVGVWLMPVMFLILLVTG